MGIQLRKLLRARVIVVFGATSRVGKATLEALAAQNTVSVALVAAVENVKDFRAQQLKRATNCFLVPCDFSSEGFESLRRAVRHADSVLLVPALSPGGVHFSKRVIDAIATEEVPRLVLVSSVLGAPELLARCLGEPASVRHRATEAAGPRVQEPEGTEGYEAVEAHARVQLPEAGRAVALRVPMMMETLLHCRDELIFANRFLGCFAPDTRVSCTSVYDVGAAAAEVLMHPRRKYEPAYRLVGHGVNCSPREVARRLSRLLGREITYKQLADVDFLSVLHEKGAPEQVGRGMVGLKVYLEEDRDEQQGDATGSIATEGEATASPPARAPRGLPEDFRVSGHFHLLTKRELMTPRHWLTHHALMQFGRTPQNQVQLFVVGSGEALFLEVSQFVARQITAPSVLPSREAGEGAIPTTNISTHDHSHGGGLQQAKVTLCTVKASPGTSDADAPSPAALYQVEGAPASPLGHLLSQLSALDVVLLIPPLRLGARSCLDVVRGVVHAAARADAWGIVLVSSLFVGAPSNRQGERECLEQLEEIENCVKSSGVPYTVVRLPIFMEYLLALSAVTEPKREVTQFGDLEEEKDETPLRGQEAVEAADKAAEVEEKIVPTPELVPPSNRSAWPLLEPSLAVSRLYLMALADAAKALTAIAFTFPLHRGRTRILYTASATLEEVQRVLQKHAHKARPVSLRRVDALGEQLGREFWRIAYWPRLHMQQFLESAVELTAMADKAAQTATETGAPAEKRTMVLPVSQRFEDITERPSMSLDQWAKENAKCYTHALMLPSAK